MGLFSSCDADDEVKRNQQAELKGPLDKRSCKDIIWLLLFIVFWVGMVVIAQWSLRNGDPYRILYGEDSFGNTCGRVRRTRNKERRRGEKKKKRGGNGGHANKAPQHLKQAASIMSSLYLNMAFSLFFFFLLSFFLLFFFLSFFLFFFFFSSFLFFSFAGEQQDAQLDVQRH